MARPDPHLTPTTASLVNGLERRVSVTGEEATRAIFTEIPAYANAYDEQFFADVRRHVEANVVALIASLRLGEPPDPDTLTFLRAPTTRRAERRIELADFLHAFRIGLRHIWRNLVCGARDDAERREALTLVEPVAEYINIASTRVTEIYVEVEQLLVAEGERVRRDVIEALVRGVPPTSGVRLEAIAAAGLARAAAVVAISALADADRATLTQMRTAAAAIGQLAGKPRSPLAAPRGDEIVAFVAVEPGSGRDLDRAVHALRESLASRHGLPLRIGVSSIVPGIALADVAYREARAARDAAPSAVLSFCGLTSFDYLTFTGDSTALRLVDPVVAAFVAEDLAADSALTSTLLAYADADLNVRVAAERLFMHTNTVHNRLRRVADRTGRDVRRLSDVIELLIAIKLAGGAESRAAGRRPQVSPAAAGSSSPASS